MHVIYLIPWEIWYVPKETFIALCSAARKVRFSNQIDCLLILFFRLIDYLFSWSLDAGVYNYWCSTPARVYTNYQVWAKGYRLSLSPGIGLSKQIGR